MHGPFDILLNNSVTMYSDPTMGSGSRRTDTYVDKQNQISQQYLEASMAANLPSFPLSDPFRQAANYTDAIYLIIQHFMRSMSTATVGLEVQAKSKTNSQRLATGSAVISDPGYEPYPDHQLNDILKQPNPADTFGEFLCQCILNWNLHGRILIWGVPNEVGAPERMYCLPIPLMTPAYQIGSPAYPLGAWRIQQYYPATGITGILPTGLAGTAGAVIDSREIYDLMNPHPVYRWSPYSHLVGGQSAVDVKNMIDISFWSIMSQGPKPTGLIDAPGAGPDQISSIQTAVDNSHGGAHKHGKMMVVGGGTPDRPALKISPFPNLANEDTLHSTGWEIFMSFLCAIFGLDMTVVGLRRTGGYAERWAAKNDAREGYLQFLVKIASLLTRGPCRLWGLQKKGVRVNVTLPPLVGYEPAEMSRDMASDGSGTLNEIRYLRGLRGADKYGDLPVSVALKLIERDEGIDDVSQQNEMADHQAELAPEHTTETSSTSTGADGSKKKTYKVDRRDRKTSQVSKNRPQNLRPRPKKGKGALGGKDSSAPKIEKKAITPSSNGKH